MPRLSRSVALNALAALLLAGPAAAGTDARLTTVAPDDRGADATRATTLTFGGTWYRYAAGPDGIEVQTSTDGLTWSAPSLALAGDAAEPSVIAVPAGGYNWLMAYSSGGEVDLAGSMDGLTYTTIPDDHPTCYGTCGAPTLLHVGKYYILDHTEHTADLDGMRVHHSEDALTWSSGLTHTLPDGADNPDIVYSPQSELVQWYLVSRDPRSGLVRLWSADKIEGTKTEVGVLEGAGLPSFYRSQGGAALGSRPGTLWISDGATVTRNTLLDAEGGGADADVGLPPAAACAAAGAVPADPTGAGDGPSTDSAWTWALPDGDTCTLSFPLAPGADFSAVTALELAWDGASSLDVALDDVPVGSLTATGTLAVSGLSTVATLTLTVHTGEAATFALYTVAATGDGAWAPLDGQGADTASPDSADSDDPGHRPGTDEARTCGCSAASPGFGPLLVMAGLAGLTGRRRSR